MASPNSGAGRRSIGGLVLLTVGVILGVLGLWLLWGSLLAPAGDQVFGPGAEAYTYQRAEGVVTLIQLLSNISPGKDGDKAQPSSDVLAIVELERQQQERTQKEGYWPTPNLTQRVIELEQRQAAEVRGWRLKQGFLMALPTLLASAGIIWLALRILRRARPPGTVFATDGGE